MNQKPSKGSNWSPHVALLLLIIVGALNIMDRSILSLLVEPIKADLHLSDTRFALLTGLAFVLVYAVASVPVAMLADRTHRVRLVAAACLIWSAFSAACGLATGFLTLSLARFGVGLGEAGGTPTSLSLIADFYPPNRRPLVIGIFGASPALGVFVGSAFGGWAAHRFGWRGAFFSVAALGLAAAPLLLLCVREPARGATDPSASAGSGPSSLRATVELFLRTPSLTLVLVAGALMAFVNQGLFGWTPAFMMRVQGMTIAQMGALFGAAAGLSIVIGNFGAGALINVFAEKSPRAYAVVPVACVILAVPFLALAVMARSWQVSLPLMMLPMTMSMVYLTPMVTLVQDLTPPSARATASAIALMVATIFGTACGPLFVGMVSDANAHAYGHQSVRVGLLWLSPFCIAAAVAYLALSRTVGRDLAEAARSTAL